MATITPQINALPMFLLILLAGHIVVVEGRNINSSKPPTFTAPVQEVGKIDGNRPETLATVTEIPPCVEITKTEAAKDKVDSDVAHSNVDPVKSYTIGLFTKPPDFPSTNAGRQKSYINCHIPKKRRFQEIATLDYADNNGFRPPPRVSTVPAHSPGDGH